MTTVLDSNLLIGMSLQIGHISAALRPISIPFSILDREMIVCASLMVISCPGEMLMRLSVLKILIFNAYDSDQ